MFISSLFTYYYLTQLQSATKIPTQTDKYINQIYLYSELVQASTQRNTRPHIYIKGPTNPDCPLKYYLWHWSNIRCFIYKKETYQHYYYYYYYIEDMTGDGTRFTNMLV